MNQASNVPTNKVAAAGIGGAVSVLAVYALSLLNVNLPPEVASALTTLVAFASGYITKEKA